MANSALSANDSDFTNLRIELQDVFSRSPRMVLLAVRMSFHDLFYQTKASGSGCIANLDFLNSFGNAGLSHPVNVLKQIVEMDKFKDSHFHFGDVVAFAGKVAMQLSYPCLLIPFKYNRNDCKMIKPDKNESSSIPSGSLSDFESLSPSLDYLGLTAEELAILTYGAHGIKGASAHVESSGWSGTFSFETSAINFISQTLSRKWNIMKAGTFPMFFNDDDDDGGKRLIRLPFDMMFFPSALIDDGTIIKDRNISSKELNNQKGIEAYLSQFIRKPQSYFDDLLGKAFTKLLLIGGGLEEFKEDVSAECMLSLNQSNPIAPPVPTSDFPRKNNTSGDFIYHPFIHHVGWILFLIINILF